MDRTPRRKQGPPEEVPFPVTPMLDMAFQLLAFFILTFQAPTRETRIDLDLPAAPVALPGRDAGPTRTGPSLRAPDESVLETDLVLRAAADARGGLATLTLNGTELRGAVELADRLRRYGTVLEGKALRVLIVADDRLRYEEAAGLIGACAEAGVAAVRLADPADRRGGSRGEP
ncbi:MAG TPA: biopolymer transporter ExbD [Isosphaeraceae bacterium]|jgi:biopolymer transport protein ExbD